MDQEKEDRKLYYSASELLPEILKNCSGKAVNVKKRKILDKWPYICGRNLYKLGRFVKVERNVLYIQSESSNYTMLFKLNQRTIMAHYNEMFPEDRIVALVVYSDSSMYSHQF